MLQKSEKNNSVKSPKSGIVITNVADLNIKNPIPFEHKGIGFINSSGKRYLPFLNPDDDFFQTLFEANLLSPTNKSCTGSKARYCLGSGWYLLNGSEDKELTKWAKKVNRKGESMNEIIKAVFGNLFVSGNSFVEVVRGKVGNLKYLKLYIKPFAECRLAVPEKGDDIPTSVLISKEFRKEGFLTITNENCIEIPLYTGDPDQKWYKDSSGDQHLIIHIKEQENGYSDYGMPTNVACLPQQILEYKAARFNMDNFDNNLVIGGVVILEGNLTQEEAKKHARNIVQQHSGDGKRGRWSIISSENGISNSKINQFQRQTDGDFIEYDKRLEEKIFLANEWSKVLIDPQSNGLGNSGKQIKEIFEVKNNTIIKPYQAFIIEKLINPVMELCDQWMNTKWSELEFGLKTVAPLSFSGEIDVNAVLTKDEGRASIGLPELEDGKGKDFIKTSNKSAQLKVTEDV